MVSDQLHTKSVLTAIRQKHAGPYAKICAGAKLDAAVHHFGTVNDKMTRIMNSATKQSRRRGDNWAPKVRIPQAQNGVDEVVNSLVRFWNAQSRDPDARVFFGPCLFGERHRLLADSMYRWESEKERQFVASWLSELARAINGGLSRWNP